MIQKFIQRPVLSTVISIIICIAGLIGLVTLPVSQYPEIAPPMVRVSTTYPGANADVVLKSVIAPLEEQINGVENMTYITSTADNNGSATIEVYFSQGTDPDMASVNVQNRVSAALSKLPAEVTQNGVTTEKMQNNMLLNISLYSTNPDYDETFLQNYGRINIYPELQRVNGVGRVNIYGARDYSMRIWIDPVKMAAYKLNPTDVMAAVQEQNVEAAPGKFGDNGNQAFQYTIKYKGKFTSAEDYGNIVIRAEDNGNILKLKDVATIELGAFDYSTSASSQGYPAFGMAVYQMAGSNANDVVKALKAKMEELSANFPDGVFYVIPYDTNKFLEASIKKVISTFFEAFILVTLVVYIFLQDLRSTIIPIISSLVAIVGTFFMLLVFDFSLNLLTLFALILAIGMVVDDAIVVVEAVHAKMEHDPSKSVLQATSEAMHEITGAIISITFVMSAVFFPVSFMTGPTGVFYRQFALTLASAMVISAVNALTLSPVLCTFFIKPKGGEKVTFMTRLHHNFNTAFDSMLERYRGALRLFTRHRWLPVAMIAAFGGVAYWLMTTTATGFIPNEDQGIIMVDVTLPAGSSLERTLVASRTLDSIARSMPEIDSRMLVSGFSILSGASGGSYSLGIISLTDWDKRDKSASQVQLELMNKANSTIKEATTTAFVPPAVSGFGVSNGFEIQLQDRSGNDDINSFHDVVQEFIAELYAQPEVKYARTAFDVGFPQYQFDVSVDKCKQLGVSVSDVFMSLQGYLGSMFVSDFNRFSKYYRVMMQAAPEDRATLASIDKIMVRNNKGEMVPVSTLVDFKRVYGPESISRYNLFTSATINGEAKDGYSTGQAIEAVRRAAEKLPAGYTLEFSGMTREEVNAGGQQIIIFLLCFIFVYLILCAQYESYMLPLSVMIPLVIGICGVFIFIRAFGIDNNIYVQVALIMLIGLLAKNGILIVEFARQRRDHGMTIVQSAIQGAMARLRPILMTSFAFIFGMVPLMIASGAGSAGNRSIGTAAAGGMLIGTVFGVFVIPTMYVIFERVDERMRVKKRARLAAEALHHAKLAKMQAEGEEAVGN
ncbi:MAG: efflux RND transporter permease subunit [Rikenellaceae bacterium]|nr:efflux RND transporter permease subunit [Rikenellaceae bacterium]